MTTLAVMKQRIADELARADLVPMIAYAISDAIKYYQSKRLLFNESRDITFDTVANQEWYDKYDHTAIPDFMAIDYMRVTSGGTIYTLDRERPRNMENTATSPATGVPLSFTYYNRQIRLYPIPDAVYEVRMVGQIKLAEPASDTEANNAWMTDGELLIRSRAKKNLARNVNAAGLDPMFSKNALMIFAEEELDSYNELKSRTAKATGTGVIEPY